MLKERLEKSGFAVQGNITQDDLVEHFRLGTDASAARTLNIYDDISSGVALRDCTNSLTVEGVSLDEAFNATMAAWEYYHRWGDNLAELVSAGATLQELVDIATPMFGNPIFIANWQGEVFAFSKEYAPADKPIRQERVFWQSIVTTGKLPITTVQHLRKSPNRDTVLHGQSASILNFPDYDYTCIIGKISGLNDVHLYLQVMQSETQLTDVSCILANAFLNMLTKIPLLDLSKGMTSLVALFCDLLELNPVAPNDLAWALATMGWGNDENLVLVSFQNSEGPLIAEAFCGQLQKHLPGAVVFVWNNHPVSILRRTDFEVAQKAVEHSARELDFLCGVSVPFVDLENLPSYYAQTKIAIRYLKTGQILGFCSDHAWQYLIDQLKNTASAAKLRHPAIAALQNYDAKNETQFLDTLYMYLICERNAVMSSNKLFIHRNTLQYRLRRINELIDANLDDPDVRNHLMLSYRIVH
jgi:hypothetical protein